MLTLLTAVAAASLLGSLHCVGMCGPFALWATSGGKNMRAVSGYHLGRLTTYLSAGLAAGVVGTAISVGGQLAGFQLVAAKLAGILLIVWGLGKLAMQFPSISKRLSRSSENRPSRIAGFIAHARPLVNSRGDFGRGYLGGLLTTWLPCGWLYLFVLLAAGTGDVMLAVATMGAFWLGSLPALTGLVMGARSIIPRFRPALPIVGAVVMVLTGVYTATGRASADLSSMVPPLIEPNSSAADIIRASETDLPCCAD
ncbi:MAG: sulfite exporter TauE/SafE family protein [Planctomycetota bacterium]